MEATAVATKTTPTEVKTEKSDKLNATHRCDSCKAQAYVEVLFSEGTFLLFCNHHWGQNKEALKNVMIDFNDETWKLVQDRLQGSEN